MFGGNVPPIPIDTVGIGSREFEYENEEAAKRKKRMLMQDEQILEIIKIWVKEND
jgi:hypothetical protein